MFVLLGRVVLASAVLINAGCSGTPDYTSLDLDLLPCERGVNDPKFFHAVEFDTDGTFKYEEQLEDVSERLRSTEFSTDNGIVTDLIIFNHGWNKNPESAESDYSQFICRLHTELVNEIGDAKRENGLLVIGVFWPSTITNKPKEPHILKPLSFYKIRNRADTLAEKSLATLYSEIGLSIRSRSNIRNLDREISLPRISLVGHSFGGRMTIRALEALNNTESIDSGDKLIDFLTSAKLLNVVLLNAAMPKENFDWIGKAVLEASDKQISTDLLQLSRFTQSTESYLFNVHSIHDTPNRLLFPLASLFNSDKAECAVGACGIPAYPTICVSPSGVVEPIVHRGSTEPDQYNGIFIWNTDAQNVINSHSDIYKGRVAKLVNSLLYDDNLRNMIVGSQNENIELGSNESNYCTVP